MGLLISWATPATKCPKRLHFLGLEQVTLQLFLLGNVPADAAHGDQLTPAVYGIKRVHIKPSPVRRGQGVLKRHWFAAADDTFQFFSVQAGDLRRINILQTETDKCFSGSYDSRWKSGCY